MTAHDPRQGSTPTDVSSSKLIRIAIWVAIGALIAAALVCVVWVLVGPSNDVIGRAFLTIFLLAAFAGVTILEARLAPRRPGRTYDQVRAKKSGFARRGRLRFSYPPAPVVPAQPLSSDPEQALA